VYDWQGENHTGKITELIDDLTQLFNLYEFFSLKKQIEKSKNEIQIVILCFPLLHLVTREQNKEISVQ